MGHPADIHYLLELLDNTHGMYRIRAEPSQSDDLYIAGKGPAMEKILRFITRACQQPYPDVQLIGEPGTGKELVAMALHYNTGIPPDKRGNFVAVNCATLDSALVNNTLFGHDAGAFTDAKGDFPGIFEQANGGTVFLDEIHHLPTDTQAKLLRVVEQKVVTREGSARPIRVSFRLVTATNQNIGDMIEKGQFLSDLAHRLSSVYLKMPALRDRLADDFELLLQYFHERSSSYHVTTVFSEEAKDRMKNHPWPGNVREFRKVIERALFQVPSGIITAEHIIFDNAESLDVVDKPIQPWYRDGAIPLTVKQIETGGYSGSYGLSHITSLADRDYFFTIHLKDHYILFVTPYNAGLLFRTIMAGGYQRMMEEIQTKDTRNFLKDGFLLGRISGPDLSALESEATEQKPYVILRTPSECMVMLNRNAPKEILGIPEGKLLRVDPPDAWKYRAG